MSIFRSFASELHIPHVSYQTDLPFWGRPLPGTVPHSSGLFWAKVLSWTTLKLVPASWNSDSPAVSAGLSSVHGFSRDEVLVIGTRASQSWNQTGPWVSHHPQPAPVPGRLGAAFAAFALRSCKDEVCRNTHLWISARAVNSRVFPVLSGTLKEQEKLMVLIKPPSHLSVSFYWILTHHLKCIIFGKT